MPETARAADERASTRSLDALPKAHVHLHVDGAYPREAVTLLAAGKGRSFPFPDRFADVWHFFDEYGRVPALVDSLDELAMRAAHAGVDHVGMDAGAVAAGREAAVERERALIDAIQSPRRFCAGLEQHACPQEAARENIQTSAHV